MNVEWRNEGNGCVGRWVRGDGDHGAFGDIEVAPEGGLHGQWEWSFACGPAAVRGTAETRREAKSMSAKAFTALAAVL